MRYGTWWSKVPSKSPVGRLERKRRSRWWSSQDGIYRQGWLSHEIARETTSSYNWHGPCYRRRGSLRVQTYITMSTLSRAGDYGFDSWSRPLQGRFLWCLFCSGECRGRYQAIAYRLVVSKLPQHRPVGLSRGRVLHRGRVLPKKTWVFGLDSSVVFHHRPRRERTRATEATDRFSKTCRPTTRSEGKWNECAMSQPLSTAVVNNL